MGFVAELRKKPLKRPICWNPYNKVVQDHRDGTVDHTKTNRARERRGLATPWTPEMADREVREKPVW